MTAGIIWRFFMGRPEPALPMNSFDLPPSPRGCSTLLWISQRCRCADAASLLTQHREHGGGGP